MDKVHFKCLCSTHTHCILNNAPPITVRLYRQVASRSAADGHLRNSDLLYKLHLLRPNHLILPCVCSDYWIRNLTELKKDLVCDARQ